MVSGYRQREKVVKSGVIGETVVGIKMSLSLACTSTIFRVKMRHLHWTTSMSPKDSNVNAQIRRKLVTDT